MLPGGAGTDSIEGLGGPDVVDLGPGVDESDSWVSGDPGADTVRARDGRLDYIDCWGGRDTVVLDRFDLYERSCERVKRRGAARPVLYGARITMQARDAFGRRYRQTIVCPDGAVEVEPPYEGESVAARIPLSDSRTCQPPLFGLDNWAG